MRADESSVVQIGWNTGLGDRARIFEDLEIPGSKTHPGLISEALPELKPVFHPWTTTVSFSILGSKTSPWA